MNWKIHYLNTLYKDILDYNERFRAMMENHRFNEDMIDVMAVRVKDHPLLRELLVRTQPVSASQYEKHFSDLIAYGHVHGRNAPSRFDSSIWEEIKNIKGQPCPYRYLHLNTEQWEILHFKPEYVSDCSFLPIDYVRKYADKIDWNVYHPLHGYSKKELLEFQKYVHCDNVAYKQVIPEEIILKFGDIWDESTWREVSRKTPLSEKIILRYADKINFVLQSQLGRTRSSALSEEFLSSKECPINVTAYILASLRIYTSDPIDFSEEFLLQHIPPDDSAWDVISHYKTLSLDLLRTLLDKDSIAEETLFCTRQNLPVNEIQELLLRYDNIALWINACRNYDFDEDFLKMEMRMRIGYATITKNQTSLSQKLLEEFVPYLPSSSIVLRPHYDPAFILENRHLFINKVSLRQDRHEDDEARFCEFIRQNPQLALTFSWESESYDSKDNPTAIEVCLEEAAKKELALGVGGTLTYEMFI